MSSFLLTCLLLLLFCANAAFHWSHSLPENICYPNISSFLLNTCPSVTPFPAIKGFITPYELFSANFIPFTDHTPCQKYFVTLYKLFFANFMLFTGPILYQKSFAIPHELFSANYIPFAIKKALLPHMIYFLLINAFY